jgi:hypothetical protein
VDVPVQFFQPTIAIELAVAGALLWEIRYFERESEVERDRHRLPDARLQLFFALVLGATMFGSLWAIADEGTTLAATLVTIGVANSLLPIFVRVLPPFSQRRTRERARSQLRCHGSRVVRLRRRRGRRYRADQHRLGLSLCRGGVGSSLG